MSEKPTQVPREFQILEADTPSGFQFLTAEGSDETPSLRRFTMTAYSGGKLLLAGFPYPVVVDLSGVKVSAKSRPILRDHDPSRIVGHTDSIEINNGSIRLSGIISGANDHAREVTDSGDNGFPWQASIGAIAQRMILVDTGESVEVNGRRFNGPLYVARQSSLREVSFVALGADDQTNAQLQAETVWSRETGVRSQKIPTSPSDSNHQSPDSSPLSKAPPMEFEAWVTAQGFSFETLTEPQTNSLRACWTRASVAEPDSVGTTATTPAEHSVTGSTPATDPTPQPPVSPVDQLRAHWALERRRIARITEICAGEHGDLEARAIEEGWDTTRTELEVLRAARPRTPVARGGSSLPPTRVLEAAVWMSAKIPEADCLKAFGAAVLEAAHPMRQIGLRELVAECARLEGHDIPRVFGDGRVTIDAGFSTVSLPGILESVMNRTMLAAYEATPIAAFQLCAIGSVSDFKEISRYRLLGTGGFEKVSPTGELKSGSLGEQKFSNKADTYGQYLILNRHDIVNDDLNAFLDLPRQMGQSGAESIDELFFSLFLSNPGNFFSTANGNFLEGANTAFGPDALTVAKTQFRKQKAGPGTKPKDQKPINIRPKYLVVPVEIETDAELLMGAAQLMVDASGTKTKIPVDNPHRNKYQVVSMPHLSDSYYAGSSSKAWYLFADPNLVPAFEIVFLNGNQTPVIEQVETPPNSLGMGFRSYIDFGVREQDPRGALKITGEAGA